MVISVVKTEVDERRDLVIQTLEAAKGTAAEIGAVDAVVILVGPERVFTNYAAMDRLRLLGVLERAKFDMLDDD